jgi:hypothetical protein
VDQSGRNGTGKGGSTTMSTLLQMLSNEKKAAYRRIASWKEDRKKAKIVLEIEDMVEGLLADRDKDERLLRYILNKAQGNDKIAIEKANAFIQKYCEKAILTHREIRNLVRTVGGAGLTVTKCEEFDRATEDYEKWKEDYPDFLIMAYKPIERMVLGQAKKMTNGAKKPADRSKPSAVSHGEKQHS